MNLCLGRQDKCHFLFRLKLHVFESEICLVGIITALQKTEIVGRSTGPLRGRASIGKEVVHNDKVARPLRERSWKGF